MKLSLCILKSEGVGNKPCQWDPVYDVFQVQGKVVRSHGKICDGHPRTKFLPQQSPHPDSHQDLPQACRADLDMVVTHDAEMHLLPADPVPSKKAAL